MKKFYLLLIVYLLLLILSCGHGTAGMSNRYAIYTEGDILTNYTVKFLREGKVLKSFSFSSGNDNNSRLYDAFHEYRSFAELDSEKKKHLDFSKEIYEYSFQYNHFRNSQMDTFLLESKSPIKKIVICFKVLEGKQLKVFQNTDTVKIENEVIKPRKKLFGIF